MVTLLFCPSVWQLSQDGPTDAGSFSHEAAVHGDTIKETATLLTMLNKAQKVQFM
jgi:hypothetical protein